MRQTVIYCCVHQLWRSLPLFSEEQLPPATANQEEEGDEEETGYLELQLLAAMLALSARSFLQQEQSIIKKKRLKQSVVEPSRGIDCSSCGPLSPRPASPAANTDTSSEVTVGYVSISPSPSDLALPNTIYSSRDNLLDSEVDYSPILSKLQFGSLVILREALLPFYIASGLQVDPQLRTLCHNSAEYFVDVMVEVREITVFVCKNIDPVKVLSSESPIMTSQLISSNPSLIGEQLAVSGCVRYCTSPQLGYARRSKRITLLKPSAYQEGGDMRESSSGKREGEEGGENNKTNISCKCCVSLDNLASTITTPLLKLSRHMTETARFRAKLRKEAKIRAEDLVPTPRPPLGDDEVDCRVPVVSVEDSLGVYIPQQAVRPSMAVIFAQNLVHKFVSIEQDVMILPQAKDSGSDTPTSTNIKILEYARSPKVSKSQAVTPVQDPAKLSIPIGYPLSDGSGGGRPIRFSGQRRLSTASNTSKSSREDVAVTIEGVDTPHDHAHNNNTSPEEVLSTQDTYGEDTTDLLSSDAEQGDTAKHRQQRVKVRVRNKDSSSGKIPSGVDHTHHHSPLKVFLLSEGELLYSVFVLLRINRIGCDVQIETTRLSLELNAISAAVDVRKSLPTTRPHPLPLQQQRTPSVDELDQLLHFDLLPTYLSVSANLRKSLIRVNDRGLPDSDILLFSALPVYGSVGVVNHTHQKLPIYRCLLKFTGFDVDIKQSPVRVHRRYQQLLPAFTKIYNDVFASSGEGSVGGVVNESATADTPVVETATSISKITSLKLPSHLPRGVIHFKIDRTNLIMAPLTSLTVTYSVRLLYRTAGKFR